MGHRTHATSTSHRPHDAKLATTLPPPTISRHNGHHGRIFPLSHYRRTVPKPLTCDCTHGGGFGTMPAAADCFGSENDGSNYGLMLTAWGTASAFGPLLIAPMRQIRGSQTSGLHVIAAVMAISMLVPILVSPPKSLTMKFAGSSPLSRSSVPNERQREESEFGRQYYLRWVSA